MASSLGIGQELAATGQGASFAYECTNSCCFVTTKCPRQSTQQGTPRTQLTYLILRNKHRIRQNEETDEHIPKEQDKTPEELYEVEITVYPERVQGHDYKDDQ